MRLECAYLCAFEDDPLGCLMEMCACMPMLVCLSVSEVLIFFVSGAHTQGPSRSTSLDSAICTGLWEAGAGCEWGLWGWGGPGCVGREGFADGEGKGDNTQQIS